MGDTGPKRESAVTALDYQGAAKEEVLIWYGQFRAAQRGENGGFVPPKPEVLKLLEAVDEWGLPFAGGYFNQPHLMLVQLAGAREGRRLANPETPKE